MAEYRIIDEPRARFSTQLIVNPLAIFLVAMFLPIVFMPPYHGRVWIPFVWLVINGILLGSPSLKKEVILATCGILLWFCLPLAALKVLESMQLADRWEFFQAYVHIGRQAAFFFFLYLIVFAQSVPYAIYQYLKERQSS